MSTSPDTTNRAPPREPGPIGLKGWLGSTPAHYIVAVIMATALASGYLVACHLARFYERQLASQSALMVERMTHATVDATEVLAPLLAGSCDAVLSELRRKTSLVPYLRSAILVHGPRASCSSRIGIVDYPVDSMFFEFESGQSLNLVPGSAIQPDRPVMTVFHRTHGRDGILFLIDSTYLIDALSLSTAGGTNSATLFVKNSGAITQSGRYIYPPSAAQDRYATPATSDDGMVTVAVRLSRRRQAEIIAAVELIAGLVAALLAALAAGTYLDAFAPDRRMLRAAAAGLERNEFFLVYQPLVDVATRRWVGAEALVRWNHPKLGPLSPQAFIDVVEASTLSEDLTRFVLKAALREMAAMEVPRGWHLAVNVAPRSICSAGFAASLARTVRESGTACAVTVEVTERELFAYDKAAINAFTTLHRDGLSLAVDDFGTENSNIDLLSRYDFDYLKIDRQYTSRLGTEKCRLVEGICALASHLSATVIAEGVEQESQHQALKKLGVPIAQGYLYQKPVPADEFARLYAARPATRQDLIPETS